MSFVNNYPYTDFHEMNLDWFLEEFKKVTDKVTTLDETVQQFTDFVTNYFDNLDVQQEVNNKLNQMAADGTLAAIIQPMFDTFTVNVNAELAAQNTSIAGVVSDVNNANTRMDTLEDRMDTFTNLSVGSTTGDAELMDGRVGIDNTTYTNIGGAVRGQATELKAFASFNAAKMDALLNGNKVQMNLNRMMITQSGYYVNASGTPTAAGPHSYIAIYDTEIAEITIPNCSATTIPTLIAMKGGNVVNAFYADANDPKTYRFNIPYDVIYLNWWYAETTPEFSAIDVLFRRAVPALLGERMVGAISGDYATVPVNSGTYVMDGYITAAGVITASGSHKIYSFSADMLDGLVVTPGTALGSAYAFAVLKDASNNVIRSFTSNNTTDPHEWKWNAYPGSTLYVCWYNFAQSPYYDSVQLHDEVIPYTHAKGIVDVVNTMKYPTIVKKPYSLAGKRLYFFGDSLVYGFSNGVQVSDPWPKTFSADQGASGYNYGVNASTFAAVAGYPQVIAAVTASDLNCDCIFIAAGVNDWQLANSLNDIETAVDTLCNYLANNFSGRVVFITPVNEAGRIPIRDMATSLQEVRNAITIIALSYGFDVVQGTDIPLPTAYADQNFIALMFDDALHPTQAGYDLIAHGMDYIMN